MDTKELIVDIIMATSFTLISTLVAVELIGRHGSNNYQMLFYTDPSTGCQYVGTKQGGLQPRTDASVYQVGCKYPEDAALENLLDLYNK